jgi:hypothetical protein
MIYEGKDLGIPYGIMIDEKFPQKYDITLVLVSLQYEFFGVNTK